MLSVLVILKNPERQAMDFESGLADLPGVSVRTAEPALAGPLLEDADVLITLGPHLADQAQAVFERAARLKWVQVIGTGVDNVLGHPALSAEVVVTNVRGVHGAQMSEAALAAMLAFARQLPKLVRHQDQRIWDRFPAKLLHGSTVGIFGLGAIAEAMAPRFKAMGMNVVGFTATPRPLRDFDAVWSRDEVARHSGDLDYLVVLAPHTPQTHHAIGAAVLNAMKPSAVLVNLARGGVVDEAALLQALADGVIAGAALDVFAVEPLPADHPFWEMPNVLITPHVGGFHEGYAARVVDIVGDNIRRYLAGGAGALINRVN